MANSSAGISMIGTSMIMCAGLAITYLFLPEGGPVAIYRTAAVGAASAISLGIFLEARGARSLVRIDLVMLVALFGLTLLEFLFPQKGLEAVVTSQSAIHGVEALFIGFSGLIIGRNFVSRRPPLVSSMGLVNWTPATLFSIYVILLFVGFFDMLMAVSFDPVELVNQMLGPRFSQAWQRARWAGGWSELVGVFSGLILYLVPALAGAMLAVPSRFTVPKKMVVVFGFLFTLFYGFSSGTRNVFCVYLITFIVVYILLRPNITWTRVFVVCGLAAGVLLFAAYYMLQFRDHGLESYIEGEPQGFMDETLLVDQNLPAISRLTDAFPETFDYLGLEFASFAILRPVPRVLWPSKPYALSHSAEDALGVQGWGWTMSTSFVGEAYMMGGYLSVLIVGLLLGGLAGWWNRFGLDLRSNVHVILYASGFLAALISMRSLLFTTTAMLPVVATWLYAKWRRRSMQVYRLRPVARKPQNLRSSER